MPNSGAAVGQHGFDVKSLQTSIASLKQIVSVGNHKRARDLAEENEHLMSENNNLKTVPSQLTSIHFTCNSMATQSGEGTVAVVHETGENEVIDRVKQLNEALQGSDQIVGRRFIEIVADVANNVDQSMIEGNRPYNVARLNAFSCVASCFAFIKSSVCIIQDSVKANVDQQKHNCRFERIQSVMNDVTAMLEEAENNIEEMRNLVKKMAEHQYSQNSDSMLFDVQFDLAVDTLDHCTSGITYAKKELEFGFASLKKHGHSHPFKEASAVLSAGGGVAGIVKALVPIIGKSYDYGVHVALIGKIGTLGYMMYKLWKDFKYCELMEAQYKDCISNTEYLGRQMESCIKALHGSSIRNVKRVKDLRVYNENLTEENRDLKEKFESLEEESERLKRWDK